MAAIVGSRVKSRIFEYTYRGLRCQANEACGRFEMGLDMLTSGVQLLTHVPDEEVEWRTRIS